jgi:hypothetical protein
MKLEAASAKPYSTEEFEQQIRQSFPHAPCRVIGYSPCAAWARWTPIPSPTPQSHHIHPLLMPMPKYTSASERTHDQAATLFRVGPTWENKHLE